MSRAEMGNGPASDDIDGRIALAHALTRDGQYEEALDIFRHLSCISSKYDVLIGLARAYEYIGKLDEAVFWYGKAQSTAPGHARPFSRIGMINARRLFGPPRVTGRAQEGAGRIGMTNLGQNGRFGNQIFQYGFLRLLAERRGLRLELPDWLGRDLFNADEPLPGSPLPEMQENADLMVAALEGRAHVGDIDLRGYCQYHTACLRPYRAQWCDALAWRPAVTQLLNEYLAPVTSGDFTLVAVHIRRGDFGYGPFWIAPTSWYLSWLAELWPRLHRPRLYVATDDAGIIGDFTAYNPMTAADLPPLPPGLGFLLDFECLRRADHVAVSNSSFSVAATLLNERASSTHRPDLVAGGLVPFTPWDTPVLLR